METTVVIQNDEGSIIVNDECKFIQLCFESSIDGIIHLEYKDAFKLALSILNMCDGKILSEQQSNCNLPHVSIPSPGVMAQSADKGVCAFCKRLAAQSEVEFKNFQSYVNKTH